MPGKRANAGGHMDFACKDCPFFSICQGCDFRKEYDGDSNPEASRLLRDYCLDCEKNRSCFRKSHMLWRGKQPEPCMAPNGMELPPPSRTKPS